MIDFMQARQSMLDSQIRPNKVSSPHLLNAFASIPREIFVPESLAALAYSDHNIPLARNRVLLDPTLLSRMVQAAQINEGDKILDIACATGYSTALFALLSHHVTGLESDAAYAEQASQNLKTLSLTTAHIQQGPLSSGFVTGAPYTVIFINGMVQEIPSALFSQLKEGGRLLTLFGENDKIGQVSLFKKTGGSIDHLTLFEASSPYLNDFKKEKQFVF